MRLEASYDDLERALAAINAGTHPAEAHGVLCGMSALPDGADKARWIAQVLDGTQPSGEAAKEVLMLLAGLYDEVQEQLEDKNLGFDLLLPDDGEALQVRADALSNWCQGFLYGLGVAGLPEIGDLPKDIREVLTDLGEISRVELDPEASEDNESAYTELVEYVRVAALLVRDNLHPLKPDAGPVPDKSTLH
ncbi:hypothetical protein DFR31_2077 [Alkalispirillum mobile]|uniref:YecA family protein n=1 Tax=Alkalispirillum mobile TaxID=85925 RepID=A0A498C5D5_9GAMM|nr:UPF0149 family protein [Alkalispirillum mobile]RLK48200.1 hypothetical protein DFR31_2077 [Alkalispirillum mobile]